MTALPTAVTRFVHPSIGPRQREGRRRSVHRRVDRFVLPLLLLAGTACAAPELTGTVPHAAGTYVLRHIDGQPLGSPGSGPFVSPFTLLADTMHIDATGAVTEIVITQRPGEAATRAVSTMTLTVRAGGARGGLLYELEYPCPGLASCIAPPHHVALLEGRWLTLTSSIVFRTPLRFERIEE